MTLYLLGMSSMLDTTCWINDVEGMNKTLPAVCSCFLLSSLSLFFIISAPAASLHCPSSFFLENAFTYSILNVMFLRCLSNIPFLFIICLCYLVDLIHSHDHYFHKMTRSNITDKIYLHGSRLLFLPSQ